ncbi:ORF6C domain-containing protein [Lactococcus lactis]|uniref:ORF6C domain-containing protein n=1 Tax=Lactococcus lactis TaxID=1358 RepID=UPI00288E763B|nr:ORF6C domain-containing protein [Lactococcus lactis]MDT2886407.1 ORF6C domain-containing protein [Lactococcus lactis]MDT2928828.1 ORF6C domain-containing protein [Lactococcus lactis]
MNQLITITKNENNDQVVSGRELHEFLEVGTPYTQWFERMVDYGFTENIDFIGLSQKSEKPQGGRPIQDHALKIDMAKEISMIQRNEKGKQARQYFIEVEKELKQQLLPQTPEQQIALLAQGNVNLNKKVAVMEDKLEDISDRMGLPPIQAKILLSVRKNNIITLLGGAQSNAYRKIHRKVYSEFGRDFNKYFEVPRYDAIPLSRIDEALEYSKTWQPSTNTTFAIRSLNSQTSFKFEA